MRRQRYSDSKAATILFGFCLGLVTANPVFGTDPPNVATTKASGQPTREDRREGDVLYVTPGVAVFGPRSGASLSIADANALSRECKAILAVAPLVHVHCDVEHEGRKYTPAFGFATTTSYLAVRDWKLEPGGRMFTDDENHKEKTGCILGHSIVKGLFGDQNPVSQDITIGGNSVQIDGVLKENGRNESGMDQDDVFILPLSSAAKFASRYNASNLDIVLVKVAAGKDKSTAITQITNILRKRHHIGESATDDFTIRVLVDKSSNSMPIEKHNRQGK